MFRRLHDTRAGAVSLVVDGKAICAQAGDTVAAAMLAAGITPTRLSAVSGEPRQPFCMMGACFECVVVIDGVANRQACLVPVRSGMVVETLTGKREVRR